MIQAYSYTVVNNTGVASYAGVQSLGRAHLTISISYNSVSVIQVHTPRPGFCIRDSVHCNYKMQLKENHHWISNENIQNKRMVRLASCVIPARTYSVAKWIINSYIARLLLFNLENNPKIIWHSKPA